jgi:two-component system, OmpR family, sensor kinase
MTIRLRLALFFTLLVGCTLVLAGTATYKLLRHGLLAGVERDVSEHAAVLARSNPNPPYNLDVFAAPDTFLQVVDGAGTPVVGSGNLGLRVLPLPQAARSGQVVEARVGGRPLYLTAAPIPQGRFIIVARSPVTIYGALRDLKRLLSYVVVAALILTGGLGWLFARAVVHPIESVVAAARAVKESRDLQQRVAYKGPPDEIGRLAATFNAMLAELDGAYRTLDQSNQRLRQFLADCAHELRTPLTVITSNLDLLAKVGNTDPAFRDQALADIRGEAIRMARMITQLLILGRADAGARTPREPVLLAEIVAEACHQGQGMADEVRFVTAYGDTLEGVVVEANPDYLKQLLLILLDNAFKYTARDGEVRVEAGWDNTQAWVTVVDSGSGIDPDDLPHIFERFYRGRNAGGKTGTGLGLAIAHWVAEQHGGSVRVESAPGRGSRFTVVLPALECAPTGVLL